MRLKQSVRKSLGVRKVEKRPLLMLNFPAELAYLIAAYLRKRDVYRLVLSCKRMGDLFLPALWHDALNTMADFPLMDVIRTRKPTYRDYSKYLKRTSTGWFTTPSIANHTGISRLDMYIDGPLLRTIHFADTQQLLRRISQLHIYVVESKIRARLGDFLESVLVSCPALRALRIDQGAEALLQRPLADKVPLRLSELSLAVHITSATLAQSVAALLVRTSSTLRYLKLTIPSCTRLAHLDPIVDAVKSCSALRHLHLVPPDNSLDETQHGKAVCRLLSAPPSPHCCRHLELVPMSECSQMSYFPLLSRELQESDVSVDELTLWAPALHDSSVLAIISACHLTLKKLTVQPCHRHAVFPSMRKDTKHSLTAEVLASLRSLRELQECTLPPLQPTADLADISVLGTLPLRLLSFSLALPSAASTPTTASAPVVPHESFAFMATTVLNIISENAPVSSLRCVRWTSRPRIAGERSVWDALSDIRGDVGQRGPVTVQCEERPTSVTCTITHPSLGRARALYRTYTASALASEAHPSPAGQQRAIMDVPRRLLQLKKYNPKQKMPLESFTGSQISSEPDTAQLHEE
ncbi:hypothetical protein RI367_000756 [Sorochytrium milnesiophthora]